MPAQPHVSRLMGQLLAAEIAGYAFAGNIASVAAAFRRVPDYTIEDLGTLKCSVIPGPVDISKNYPTAPRGADLVEVSLGVVLAKHVASEQEIQDMEDLNMELFDAIRSQRVVPPGIVSDWTTLSMPVPFDREALSDRSVWMSQLEVTYLVQLDKLPPPAPPEEE